MSVEPRDLVVTLDSPAAVEPSVAGAKAAWLARGRQSGLSVLPGVVVACAASTPAMNLALEVMAHRGSGGARLAMSQEPLPIPLSEAILESIGALGTPLVVRSSSILEDGGEWAGAFTSYLDIAPSEVERAVRGCWASAFTVHTLERYEAAEIAPGSAPMAVLIQPAVDPNFGGTAHYSGTDLIVVGVEGSPAPLVQGWEPGVHARVTEHGEIRGDPAIQLLGEDLIRAVAQSLATARDQTGANTCEWAATDDGVILLQLGRATERTHASHDVPSALASEAARRVAAAARRAPGPLGEALVISWAVADPTVLFEEIDPIDIDPVEALRSATEHARQLTATVWEASKPIAAARAQETLREVRGAQPEPALEAIAGLRPADHEQARLVLGLLAQVRRALVAAGAVSRPELAWHVEPEKARSILMDGHADELRTRIGFDRWEPFDAGVIILNGAETQGVAAAPGLAAGRMCFISDPHDTAHFRPRDVVVGVHPVPNLAALLWDAAALVTTGGGPGAHLFESARALAIPAVCGIHLDEALGMSPSAASTRTAMAVDGSTGKVTVMPW
jgi:hypothetical protein